MTSIDHAVVHFRSCQDSSRLFGSTCCYAGLSTEDPVALSCKSQSYPLRNEGSGKIQSKYTRDVSHAEQTGSVSVFQGLLLTARFIHDRPRARREVIPSVLRYLHRIARTGIQARRCLCFCAVRIDTAQRRSGYSTYHFCIESNMKLPSITEQ